MDTSLLARHTNQLSQQGDGEVVGGDGGGCGSADTCRHLCCHGNALNVRLLTARLLMLSLLLFLLPYVPMAAAVFCTGVVLLFLSLLLLLLLLLLELFFVLLSLSRPLVLLLLILHVFFLYRNHCWCCRCCYCSCF